MLFWSLAKMRLIVVEEVDRAPMKIKNAHFVDLVTDTNESAV